MFPQHNDRLVAGTVLRDRPETSAGESPLTNPLNDADRVGVVALVNHDLVIGGDRQRRWCDVARGAGCPGFCAVETVACVGRRIVMPLTVTILRLPTFLSAKLAEVSRSVKMSPATRLSVRVTVAVVPS